MQFALFYIRGNCTCTLQDSVYIKWRSIKKYVLIKKHKGVQFHTYIITYTKHCSKQVESGSTVITYTKQCQSTSIISVSISTKTIIE